MANDPATERLLREIFAAGDEGTSMATTIPTVFTGTPELTPARTSTIMAWYHEALANSDKADDADEVLIYGAEAGALESVLRLLFDMPIEED